MDKKTLAQFNADLQKQNTLLSHALQVKAGSIPPEGEVTLEHDTGHSIFSLYDSDQADGGIIVQTYFVAGQRPHTTVMYAEEFFSARWFTHYTVEQADKLGKLRR